MNRLPAPDLPDWLSHQVPFDRYRVQCGDIALHVMETGQGTPVLLLHGNPTWGFLYRKVAAALTGTPVRLVMPDLMGLGWSDKPQNPQVHSLEKHAQKIGQLIDNNNNIRHLLPLLIVSNNILSPHS